MNNAPSNQTGAGGNTFSQGGSQSNPFTADLKGEFTSNFGTNTNAVSQIFKEGGFVSSNRTKYLLIAAGVLVVLAVVFYFYTSDSSSDETDEDVTTAEQIEPKPSDQLKKVEPPAAVAPVEPKPIEQAIVQEAPAVPARAARSARSEAVLTGTLRLASPGNGSAVDYDETTGAALFTWKGSSGGRIVFSRSSSMRPEAFHANVSGNTYNFNHPWPGTWFWRVDAGGSSSDVRSFTVNAPARRSITVSQPQSGGSVAGSGGVVGWQAAERVAFYRVEFSNGSWANPQFRFATSGNSVQLQGVTAGQYQMRVGGFSEVSGRWEYTAPVPVTVQ